MTCARRAAAALAATFCVLFMLDRPPAAEEDRWCAGDIAGEDDPVLLEPPLFCREYTGLPALLRSIADHPLYSYESKTLGILAGGIPRDLSEGRTARGQDRS